MRSTTLKLNDKKTINGWAMFDWANSAFALVITAAIFPGYFSEVTQGTTEGILDFGWIKLENTAVYAYATSIAYLIITLLSPLLSGIADYGGKRKFFLRFFYDDGFYGLFVLVLF